MGEGGVQVQTSGQKICILPSTTDVSTMYFIRSEATIYFRSYSIMYPSDVGVSKKKKKRVKVVKPKKPRGSVKKKRKKKK